MTTFAKLIENVKKDLRATDGARLSDEDIREAINDAIFDYETERFSFNEGDTTFNTVPPTTPVHMLEIDEIQYDQGPRRYRLNRIHYREWVTKSFNQNNSRGPAFEYTIHSQNIHFFPTPDNAEEVTVTGLQRLTPSPLTDPTTTNGWTDEGRRLIRARADWDLSLNRLRNPDAASVYKSAETDAAAMLRQKTTQYLATGHSYVPDWEYR